MSDTPETDAVAVQFYAASTVTNSYLRMVDHARKLERQRDALMEALKKCSDELEMCMDTSTLSEDSPTRKVYYLARKAIEECK